MNIDLVRFWKDAKYRQSLRTQEQMSLPENPVGEVELTEAELSEVTGATNSEAECTGFGSCITGMFSGGCYSCDSLCS